MRLPFGHPVAIAVCLWIGVALYRRLRHDVPFDSELDGSVFGDRFEKGPPAPESRVIKVENVPVRTPARSRTGESLPGALSIDALRRS